MRASTILSRDPISCILLAYFCFAFSLPRRYPSLQHILAKHSTFNFQQTSSVPFSSHVRYHCQNAWTKIPVSIQYANEWWDYTYGIPVRAGILFFMVLHHSKCAAAACASLYVRTNAGSRLLSASASIDKLTLLCFSPCRQCSPTPRRGLSFSFRAVLTFALLFFRSGCC